MVEKYPGAEGLPDDGRQYVSIPLEHVTATGIGHEVDWVNPNIIPDSPAPLFKGQEDKNESPQEGDIK